MALFEYFMESNAKNYNKVKTGTKLPNRKWCAVIAQPTNAVLRLPPILLGSKEKILAGYQNDLFLP